jgi:dTDP-4-dehydrorhamnose 3,5-epimerase
MVVKGAALIGAVEIDDWEKPSKDSQPEKFVLSDQKPAILYIPANYANGFMSLTADTKIIFFSSSTLEESKGDDFRYSARYWDIWQIEER